MITRLVALGDRNAEAGARRARAAALVLLALPGSAYLYQGEELGLPEVTDIPDDARQDPRFFRTKRRVSRAATAAAFPSPGPPPARVSASPERGRVLPLLPPWLPQPPDWGSYSVESQLADEHSFLNLYRAALRLRRDHPALGAARCAGSTRRRRTCCASPGTPASSSPSTSARCRCRSLPTARSSSPAVRWQVRALAARYRRLAVRLRPTRAFSFFQQTALFCGHAQGKGAAQERDPGRGRRRAQPPPRPRLSGGGQRRPPGHRAEEPAHVRERLDQGPARRVCLRRPRRRLPVPASTPSAPPARSPTPSAAPPSSAASDQFSLADHSPARRR